MRRSMRIDPATGAFTLRDGTRLSPALGRAEFLRTPVGQAARVAAQAEPWLSVAFDLPEERLAVELQFEGERLRWIELASTAQPSGMSWEDWSETSEQARALETARWLERHGLAAGAHPWGEVWSGYEPRSGAGHAVVSYGEGAS
ncbi:MAG: hypothetical protein QM767_27590 [Anaeromyxobacter sp.]